MSPETPPAQASSSWEQMCQRCGQWCRIDQAARSRSGSVQTLLVPDRSAREAVFALPQSPRSMSESRALAYGRSSSVASIRTTSAETTLGIVRQELAEVRARLAREWVALTLAGR
jgi:hypothetical protein